HYTIDQPVDAVALDQHLVGGLHLWIDGVTEELGRFLHLTGVCEMSETVDGSRHRSCPSRARPCPCLHILLFELSAELVVALLLQIRQRCLTALNRRRNCNLLSKHLDLHSDAEAGIFRVIAHALLPIRS
ncbi:hypothetical protein PFISCL1PPCAC_12039, partial [Pristionchus fissidentatus]